MAKQDSVHLPAGKPLSSECAQTIFDTNTAQQLHSTKQPVNYTHIYTAERARAWRIAETSQPGMLGKAGNQTSVFCHDNNTKAKASLMRQFLLITKANAAGIAAIAQHTSPLTFSIRNTLHFNAILGTQTYINIHNRCTVSKSQNNRVGGRFLTGKL